jgi:hypothetical protein
VPDGVAPVAAAPEAAAPAPAGGEPAPVVDAPDFTVEGFPEKFLDADGKPNWSKLATSYVELENKLHSKEGEDGDEQKPSGAPAEGYELVLPEGADNELITTDDPLVKEIFAVGKEHGITQDAMNGMTGKFVEVFTTMMHTHKETEMDALGDDANEVVGRVGKFFAQHLDTAQFEVFKTMSVNADQMRVLDEIRSLALKSPSLNGDDDGLVPSTLTEDDLRAMIKTDAYQDSSHPDHKQVLQQVTEGYNRLYKPKQG